MAITITDNSFYYTRRTGDFPSSWAAMTPWCISASKTYGKEFVIPTTYEHTGRVYAAKVKNTAMSPFGAFWIGNGATIFPYGMNTESTSKATAISSPFIVCVTYDSFRNINVPSGVTQWRELGINPDITGNPYGFTNRLIDPDIMGGYIYITGLYVFDNSNDGNVSTSNPRTLLSNYDIFTPVNISKYSFYKNGEKTSDRDGTLTYLISMFRQLTPYYTSTAHTDTTFPAQFNPTDCIMRALGAGTSPRIVAAGINTDLNSLVRVTLYPNKDALIKDIYAWGIPFTTDYNAARTNNVDDFPDNVTPGVPSNPSGGGDGDGDNFSDDIPFPPKPFSPSSLGGYLSLIQSPAELETLTGVLWKPVIKDLSDALKVYFNTDNLTNSVLSIMFFPLDLGAMPLDQIHSDTIRIAWSTDDISADIMGNKVSHAIDAGAYTVKEYYGSFLDYAPYTTADIWLPYIGYKPLDIDAVMGKTLSVKYFVDFIDGLATAVIFADGQPINTYTGQLGIDLAVTGRDNAAKLRQTVDAVMTAATGINKSVSGVMSGAAQATAGNVGGALGAASGVGGNLAGGVASLAQAGFQQASTVIYGTAGGENWLSMPQRCHIKFTRTVAASPASYIDEMGYPTTYTAPTKNFTGFLKCASVFGDFDGVPADEADEIVAALSNGVHIKGGAFE